MKTKILFSLFLLMSSIAFAQVESNYKDKSRFGVRAGASYLKYSDSDFEKFEYGTGFDAGIFYKMRFFRSQKAMLPIELIYSNYSFDSQLREFNLSKVSLNMFVDYYVTKNFFIEAGYSVGGFIFAKADIKPDADMSDFTAWEYEDDASPIVDLSLGGGLGYEFNNRIFVNARVMYDIMNAWLPLSTDKQPHLLHTSFSIGYSF